MIEFKDSEAGSKAFTSIDLWSRFKECLAEWEALENSAGDISMESKRSWERRCKKRLQLFDLIMMCEKNEAISDDQRKELREVKRRLSKCLADENAKMFENIKQQEETGQSYVDVNEILRDVLGDPDHIEDDSKSYIPLSYIRKSYISKSDLARNNNLRSNDTGDDNNKQEERYKALRAKAEKIVMKYAEKAFNWGCVPVAANFSFPITYGKMISKLAGVYGLSLSSDDKESIVAICLGNALMAPVFSIPFLSGSLAKDLLKDYGKEFIDATERTLRRADGTETDREILNTIASDIKSRK